MSDRAPQTHAQAIAARAKFLANQAKERERLTAELREAEAEYEAWVAPKRRFEKAKNDSRLFEIAAAGLTRESESQVIAAADPRIHAAIKWAEGEQEKISDSLCYQAVKQGQRAPNSAGIDRRVHALRTATGELNALLRTACDDVPGAIQAVLAKVQPFEMEPA